MCKALDKHRDPESLLILLTVVFSPRETLTLNTTASLPANNRQKEATLSYVVVAGVTGLISMTDKSREPDSFRIKKTSFNIMGKDREHRQSLIPYTYIK